MRGKGDKEAAMNEELDELQRIVPRSGMSADELERIVQRVAELSDDELEHAISQ
jgi:hypothetical protein